MNLDLMSLLWPLIDVANEEPGVAGWLRNYVARTVATPIQGRLIVVQWNTRRFVEITY